ncbi:response regulator [Vibrio splendidus]|uniref:response regulator n=1 Tax=Vibrio splendidus TaxID=29497 RepID=UPI0011B1EFD8|nr:response regulator [Vibrio splendidus]
MKLTYHVLCIDDKIRTLDEDKDNLSLFNSSVGIETKYTDIEAVPTAREDEIQFLDRLELRIQQAFDENTYDMILIDLHMPLDVTGADLIYKIRENHTIYRPIIFYSAGEPEVDDKAIEQLKDASQKSNLSGKSVLISSRKTLFNEASSIFKEMHAEEHKVNHVRGLLMDRVSEFDASVGELVQNEKLLNLVPGDAKPRIASDVIGYLKSDLDRTQRLYNSIKQLRFEDILKFIEENPKDISTYRKGYILKDILRKIDDTRDFAAILSEGIDGTRLDHKGEEIKNLREIRNEYGHITAENLEAIHNDEMCIDIRKESRRQLSNITNINKLLKES